MNDSEECFPRGFPAKQANSTERKRHSVTTDNLFKVPQRTKDGSASSEKVKDKKKEKDPEAPQHPEFKVTSEDEEAITIVDYLQFKKLHEGMLLLGCVKDIFELELVISLPNFLIGFVKATRISQMYTSILQQQLQSDKSAPMLSDLFEVGQLVVCSVCELNPVTKSIQLSIDPHVINQSLSLTSLKPGRMISCVIKSVEDHGYIVDIGRKDVNAFISNEHSDLDHSHKPCQVVRCVVVSTKGEGKILMLSDSEKKITKTLAKAEQGITLDTLYPGTMVKFFPTRTLNEGTIGTFLNFKGSITVLNSSNLTIKEKSKDTNDTPDPGNNQETEVVVEPKKKKPKGKNGDFVEAQDAEPKKFKQPSDRTIVACVLYVTATKQVALCANSKVWRFQERADNLLLYQEKYSIGRKSRVTVLTKIKGIGLICRVEKSGPLGIVYMKNLSDTRVAADFSNFVDKKNCKARIIKNISLDGVLELSLKQSTLDAAYLRYEDLYPGMLVKAKINSIEAKGLLVALGSIQDKEFKECRSIIGFVPAIHMSDIVLKHPEKKFNKGDILTCRILSVNPKRRHLHLTNKSTLVHSKQPPITSYEQLKVGAIVHPFIISMREFGVIVNLYNNVKGMVPRNELSTEPIEFLEKEFYIGQVVRSRVLSCDPESENLKLSFRITPRPELELALKEDALKPGQIVSGKIIRKKVDAGGFDVQLLKEKTSQGNSPIAFLQATHLSDFKTLSDAMFLTLTTGTLLNQCLITSVKPLRVSMKKTLINYVTENYENPLVFADLQDNLTFPAFVHHTKHYGVFVGLPNGLVGLCLKSTMADHYLPSSHDHYFAGQSVVATITGVDREKEKFTVSLRPSECKNDVSSRRVCLYFNEAQRFFESQAFSIKLGEVVNVNAEKVDDESSVKITIENVDENLFTGVFVDGTDPSAASCEAVVMRVDCASRQVHLSNQKTVVKYHKSDMADKIAPDTLVYTHVLYVDDDITIAYITSHGSTRGRLIYLSTKSHWNDVSDSSSLYEVGQMVQVRVVNICENGILLGELKLKPGVKKRVRQDSEMSDSSVGDVAQDFGDLKVGEKLEGTVRSIRATCALVHIPSRTGSDGRSLVGRLHASEVSNEVGDNTIPLRNVKVGQTIACHVIGCRDVKTHKFLDITHRKLTRGVLELSLRRNTADFTEDDANFQKIYYVGKKVVAFVKSHDKKYHSVSVEIKPGIRGYIPRLLLSESPKLLEKVESKFRPGRALHCTIIQNDNHKLVLSSKGSVIDGATGDDITDILEGCVANAEVREIVSDGLLLKTAFRTQGKAFITDLFDNFIDEPLEKFTQGQIVRCRVVHCAQRNRMILSLQESMMHVCGDGMPTVAETAANDISNLKPKQIIQGYVKNCTKSGIFVTLSRELHGRVTFDHASKYFLGDETMHEVFFPGKLVTCCVLSTSPLDGKVELSLLEDHVGGEDIIPKSLGLPLRKRKCSEQSDASPVKKKRARKVKNESKKAVEKIIKKSITKRDQVEVKSTLNEDDCEMVEEPGFVWEDAGNVAVSSDVNDDEDSGIEDKPAPQTLTRSEKEDLLMREEEAVNMKELELMDETRLPKNASEWERLMMSNPDNSMLWVRYMAYHLHATEIDKSRAVAEKALKTINFREEQEKLNVWVSLLNLENLHGSDDRMQQTLERALEQNDQLKVLNHLLNIYSLSSKSSKEEEIHQKLIKKFRKNKDVWLAYMRYLMLQNQHQVAQETMKKSLIALERKQHLEVICKFAQMEFSLGDVERGRTIFENAISSYPRRTDVWSIYIDTLIKAKRIEDAREVFGRVTTISFSSKKMKSFFKRFLEFETKYGNEDNISEAKQKAMDYIEMEASKSMQD